MGSNSCVISTALYTCSPQSYHLLTKAENFKRCLVLGACCFMFALFFVHYLNLILFAAFEAVW